MFVTIFKSGQMFLYTTITRSVAATHSMCKKRFHLLLSILQATPQEAVTTENCQCTFSPSRMTRSIPNLTRSQLILWGNNRSSRGEHRNLITIGVMDAPVSFVCDHARRKRGLRTQPCQTRMRKRAHTVWLAELDQAQHITALSRHRRNERNNCQIAITEFQEFLFRERHSFRANG